MLKPRPCPGLCCRLSGCASGVGRICHSGQSGKLIKTKEGWLIPLIRTDEAEIRSWLPNGGWRWLSMCRCGLVVVGDAKIEMGTGHGHGTGL